MKQTAKLRELLAQGRTIWAPGAYDALSARMIEEAGFTAAMATGYGISASFLGEPDVELYTMTENLEVVRRMVAVLSIPLIADCDTGYGNVINVTRTVREFEAAGVAGLLLEDQASPKKCPAMTAAVELVPIEQGAARIRAAVSARRDPDLVIIARTDAANEEEAIRRLRAYTAAGADVVHAITGVTASIDGFRRIRDRVGMPLSIPVLGWTETIPPAAIESVAAIAFPAFAPLMTVAEALRRNLRALAATKSAVDLPQPMMSPAEFKRFIGFPQVEELHNRLEASPEAAAV